MIKPGDILKASLSQSDGAVKVRPVLLIAILPHFGDYLVCGISSQLQHYTKDFDLLIDKKHPDFLASGLIKPSLIRLSFIASIPAFYIEGSIGGISQATLNVIKNNLINFLLTEG